MVNYKELFYRSQAKLAEAIEQMDLMSAQLKVFMCDAEECVIHQNEITVHLSDENFRENSEQNEENEKNFEPV